jgi:hypothetical protein
MVQKVCNVGILCGTFIDHKWSGGSMAVLCLMMCRLALGANVVAGLAATNVVPDVVPNPPIIAREANYTNLVFRDEFNSMSTIDVKNTKLPGYNWYVQKPFHGRVSGADEYHVTNGALVVGGGDSYGWELSTWSGSNGNGHAFRYGYFEARVHFDPNEGQNSRSWPAFWSFPVEHAWGPARKHWNELDFFEAYTGGFKKYNGGFFGTVHDWQVHGTNKPVNFQNTNNYTPLSVDWNQWHVLGCLWMPGKITWCLDDSPLQTLYYSSGHDQSFMGEGAITNSPFSIMDSQNNIIVLGSSKGWPMFVDYVRVWQK